MKLSEFSSQFSVKLNSFAPSGSIELDEYEKSVLLTEAQEEEILSLYTGRNSALQSFEETEETRRYLSNLTAEMELTPSTQELKGISNNSTFFSLPDGKDGHPAIWFITYESVLVSGKKCEDTTALEVVPVTQDEYHRIKNNPFRRANDRRALRFDFSGNLVEIVSKYPITSYYVRYLRKPYPIILVNLANDNLSIEGYTEPKECEVHEGLHHRILNRAVQLALARAGIQSQSEQNRKS